MARIPGVHSPTRYTGLILSNNGLDLVNDIDIAAGSCFDSTGQNVLSLSSLITKRLDANWAVGTNQGGLDTGSKAASTFYYLYVIGNGSNVDVLFSASPTSPTMPSGYTTRRRIGAVFTDGSSSIYAFNQFGNKFSYKTAITGFATTVSTGGQNSAITAIPVLDCIASGWTSSSPGADGQGDVFQVLSPNSSSLNNPVMSTGAGGAIFPNFGVVAGRRLTGANAGLNFPAGSFECASNNGQLYLKAASGTNTLYIYIVGWIDLSLT